ncbi:NB-ARC domain-containing protein [Actinacidiphila oryziradicis]|uniref:hypothetical protein n=1 Tax=Actinacidiphila oryziradicis TaxID=2571141 RepID=UPI001FE5917A|nr:hypothetical protein [Actinacidiphila oryziradicis]
MTRWPWRKDGGDGDAAASGQASAGSSGGAPLAAGGIRQTAARSTGGTWQEVFHSGNATGSDGAFVNTGIYNSTVNLPPEALRSPAEVDAFAGLDDLPYRPGLFVGRGCELDRLDAALAAPGAALVQAVHGLGGIGKSTLAAHWAATRPHGRAPIRWITADSPAAIRQGLADLATALQPVLAQVLPDMALAEWGLQWLASHTGWLIVLDNANDPADIARLIARAPSGRFLITSRLATAWSDATTLVRLDILEPPESLALLTRIATAHSPGRDLDGAAGLCAELGHLPLAIEQAAAYLAQNPRANRVDGGTVRSAYDAAVRRREGTKSRRSPRAGHWRHQRAWLRHEPGAGRLRRPSRPDRSDRAARPGRLHSHRARGSRDRARDGRP